MCEWSVSRDIVDFGQINIIDDDAQPVTQTLEFISEAFHLVDLQLADVSWLRASIAKDGTIEFLLTPSLLPPGQNTLGLRVVSDNEVLGARVVDVRATGVAGLRAYPRYAVFKVGHEVIARFLTPEDELAEIASASSSDTNVDVALMERGQIRLTASRPIDASRVVVVDRYGRKGLLMVSVTSEGR
jgi:hypothetical protein